MKVHAPRAAALLLMTELLTVSAYGQAARVVSLETSSPTWRTGDPAIAISDTLQVKTVSGNVSSAKVQIAGSFHGDQDVLTANVAGTGLTAVWNISTGVLTISGVATAKTYQAALRTVTYGNYAAIPNTNPRIISITITDGGFTSPPVTRTLNLERILPSTTMFSVSSYGAVGDGVHDDGPAIAQGVQAAAAAGAAGQIAELDFEGNKTYYVGSAPAGGIAINLSNAHNVRIMGNGSTLIARLPNLFLNISDSTGITVSGFHTIITPHPFLMWTVKNVNSDTSYDLQLNPQYAALPSDAEIAPSHFALRVSGSDTQVSQPAVSIVSIAHIDATNDGQKIARLTTALNDSQARFFQDEKILTEHPDALSVTNASPISVTESRNVLLADVDIDAGIASVLNIANNNGPVTFKRLHWEPKSGDAHGNGFLTAVHNMTNGGNHGSIRFEDCALINANYDYIPMLPDLFWNAPISLPLPGAVSEALLPINTGSLLTPMPEAGDTIAVNLGDATGLGFNIDHARVIAVANRHVVLDHPLPTSIPPQYQNFGLGYLRYVLDSKYNDPAIIRRSILYETYLGGSATLESNSLGFTTTAGRSDLIGNTLTNGIDLRGDALFFSGNSWIPPTFSTISSPRQAEIWDTVLGMGIDIMGGVFDQDNTGDGLMQYINIYGNSNINLAQDPSYVTGISLIDFETLQPIPGYDPIQNNQVIPLSTLPTTHLNLRANGVGTFDKIKYDVQSSLFAETQALTASSAPYLAYPLGWKHDDAPYSVVAYPVNGANLGRGHRVKFRVATLLPGWTGTSIGSAPAPGSAYQMGNILTVAGAGGDIGGTSDSEEFASKTIIGDADLVTQVTSQTITSPGAKAGLQFRDGALPSATNVTLAVTPGNLITFQSRGAAGGSTTQFASSPYPALPYWLRLKRAGSSFSAYTSVDGQAWTQLGTAHNVSMPQNVQAGVAATGNSTLAETSTATFENTVVSNLSDGWLAAEAGSFSAPGPVQYRTDGFALSAGAGDLAGVSDQAGLVYKTIIGDGIIQARAWDIASASAGSKTGVIVRDSLTPSAPYFGIFVTADGKIVQQWRTAAGATTSSTTPVTAPGKPVWLRVIRQGSLFTGSYSLDRVTWTLAGPKSIPAIHSAAIVGLAVSGGGAPAKADLETVGIGSVSSAPAITYLSPNAAPAGSAAFTLTILGSGFSRLSTVVFGSDINLYPTFVDENTLTVDIPAADLTAAGTVNVRVSNPAPGGGTATTIFKIGSITGAKLTGTPISSPAAAGFPAANAFDGNINTQFKSLSTSGGWVGLDLGRTHKVITAIQLHNPAGAPIDGGTFQAANKKDFSDAVTLATVTTTASPTFVTGIGNLDSFRYVRYLAKPGTYCVAAELEFDGGYPRAPLPSITSTYGQCIFIGPYAGQVQLIGMGFKSTSTILVNGVSQQMIYQSATSMYVFPSQSFNTAAGVLNIQVVTPSPNGGSSNVVELPVVAQPRIASFTLSSMAVTGGTGLTATLKLTDPAPPGDWTVRFSSSNAAASIASHLVIPEGQISIAVPITTKPVDTAVNSTIQANNIDLASANFKINPAALSSIAVSPTVVKGGATAKVTVTVTLTGKAGPSGVSVALAASDNTIIPPGTAVMVPAGTASAVYTFTPPAIAADKTITIKGTGGGVVRTAPLTISAPVLTSLATSTAAPHSGQAVTVKVIISTPAPAAGLKVTLTSSSASLPVTPGYITVPAGGLIGSLTVTSKTVTASTPVTLTAKLNTVTLTKSVTIAP